MGFIGKIHDAVAVVDADLQQMEGRESQYPETSVPVLSLRWERSEVVTSADGTELQQAKHVLLT